MGSYSTCEEDKVMKTQWKSLSLLMKTICIFLAAEVICLILYVHEVASKYPDADPAFFAAMGIPFGISLVTLLLILNGRECL